MTSGWIPRELVGNACHSVLAEISENHGKGSKWPWQLYAYTDVHRKVLWMPGLAAQTVYSLRVLGFDWMLLGRVGIRVVSVAVPRFSATTFNGEWGFVLGSTQNLFAK